MKKIFGSFFILLLSLALLSGVYFYLKYQESDYNSLINQAYKRKNDFNQFLTFDGEFEPDIPDKEINSKDHLGVDLNKNGIRDDIDIWIDRMGKNFNERMAMRQYAKALQTLQQNCHENNFSHGPTNLLDLDQSRLCLSVISDYGRDEKNYGVSMLNLISFNTDLRKTCYRFDNHKKIEGVISIDLLKTNCHFEIYDPKSIIEVSKIKASY